MIIIHTLLLRVKAEGVEASRWSGSREADKKIVIIIIMRDED